MKKSQNGLLSKKLVNFIKRSAKVISDTVLHRIIVKTTEMRKNVNVLIQFLVFR